MIHGKNVNVPPLVLSSEPRDAYTHKPVKVAPGRAVLLVGL